MYTIDYKKKIPCLSYTYIGLCKGTSVLRIYVPTICHSSVLLYCTRYDSKHNNITLPTYHLWLLFLKFEDRPLIIKQEWVFRV